MSDLLQQSALELARRIRAREVSPVEVVEAHLARVEDVNPHLNAIVQPLYAQARRQAREAEAAVLRADRARPNLPPFHGV
ncbi:MAG: amidase, partial [Myxococcales bacterium]|nr:amidase [Myxococcales bacterium]